MATRGSRPATEPVLVITRVFDAPRDLVFKAWTEPERLMRWWGPKGFTTPFCKTDVRPGGIFHYCMRSPASEDFWGKGVYREIVVPEWIVYTDFFSDEAGNLVERPGFPLETLVTVTFDEHEGKTKVTVQHAGLVVDQGELQGWTEMLDRFEDYVANV